MPETRKPQDHKPKAAPPDAKKRIEFDGETYELDPESFDDVDFMDLLAEMDSKPFYMPRVVRFLLGDEQWERFKVSHKGENGRVGASQLGDFFTAASEQLNLGN